MNIKLDPPQIRPLSPSTRSRLRNRVMDKTRPSRSTTRRWLVPVVAVGAVTAVVAGTLAITNGSVGAPGVTGTTPTTTPTKSRTDTRSTKLPAKPVPPQSIILLPFPTTVDLGPVQQAEAEAAARKSCRVPGTPDQPVQVLWARRVKGISRGTSLITMIIQAAGQRPALCQPGFGFITPGAGRWAQQPTEQHGATELGGGSGDNGPTNMYFQQWTVYRVRPEITRIEARYVWKTGAGPWIGGVVAAGFAYTDVRGIPVPDATGLTRQVRAYDAQGRRVPV